MNNDIRKLLQDKIDRKHIDIIKCDASDIQYIEHPSEKVQLEAVNLKEDVIRFIENPSEKVQLAVIKKRPNFIQYIKNPSEHVQLEAVKNNLYSIRFIENPTEKVKKYIINKDNFFIKYFKNVSKELIVSCIKSVNKYIELNQILDENQFYTKEFVLFVDLNNHKFTELLEYCYKQDIHYSIYYEDFITVFMCFENLKDMAFSKIFLSY